MYNKAALTKLKNEGLPQETRLDNYRREGAKMEKCLKTTNF